MEAVLKIALSAAIVAAAAACVITVVADGAMPWGLSRFGIRV